MAKKAKFKFGINTLINWGASVVIVGLMFKILHFKGGEWMIGIGLAVEALLFFVMGFMATEKEPDWTRVYPELDEEFNGELPKASVRPVSAVAPTALGNTAALDQMLQNANISPDLIGHLGDGLRSFGDKVAAISNTADTATATTQFADKLNQATRGVDKLSASFDQATTGLQAFNESAEDMKQFKEQVNAFNKNLTSLNAIYGGMLTAMGGNKA